MNKSSASLRLFRALVLSALVLLGLMTGATALRAQWLKSLFGKKPEAPPPATAPAAAPAPPADDAPLPPLPGHGTAVVPAGAAVPAGVAVPAGSPVPPAEGNSKARYDRFVRPLYYTPQKAKWENLPRQPRYDKAKLLGLVPTHTEKQHEPVTAKLPTIEGAELVNDDTLCATCHEAYVRFHRTNIHRNQSCEACHGPASEHLKTRGTKPGTILNVKNLKPAEQSEICLNCHTKHVKEGFPGPKWRTSAHAHGGESCVSCHRNHYNVPPGTKATDVAGGGEAPPPEPKPKDEAEKAAREKAIRTTFEALGSSDPATCNRCHMDKPDAPKNAPKIDDMMLAGHPHQIDGPGKLKCTTCHDPHGVIRNEARTDLCLKCHNGHKQAPWATSSHARAGMACTDCHNPHSAVKGQGAASAQTCNRCHTEKAELSLPGHPHMVGGANGMKCSTCHNAHDNLSNANRLDQCNACHNNPKTQPFCASSHAKAGLLCTDCHEPHSGQPMLGAANSKLCTKCHTQMNDLIQVAHPHQVGGVNGFQCVTCHNAHDDVRPFARGEQCLTCHRGHPTMAWKSSTHFLTMVSCTDCHNPHPVSRVPLVVDIDHNQVNRPPRMPMSVDEPLVCYRCHPKIAALFNLPFRHPVRDGKMLCSQCHDSHGEQNQHLLREPTVNLVCYRCHSEKQGPFVWEHPPVTENCDICHNPHGTVTKQLLKQPPTFLCLRCHSGHHGQRRNLTSTPAYRPAFFTDCQQCHSQVHGSDLPSATRKGPRLTR